MNSFLPVTAVRSGSGQLFCGGKRLRRQSRQRKSAGAVLQELTTARKTGGQLIFVTPGMGTGGKSSFIFQSRWSGTSFCCEFMACSQLTSSPV